MLFTLPTIQSAFFTAELASPQSLFHLWQTFDGYLQVHCGLAHISRLPSYRLNPHHSHWVDFPASSFWPLQALTLTSATHKTSLSCQRMGQCLIRITVSAATNWFILLGPTVHSDSAGPVECSSVFSKSLSSWVILWFLIDFCDGLPWALWGSQSDKVQFCPT